MKKEFNTPTLGSNKKIKSDANKSEHVSSSGNASLQPGFVSERLGRPNQLLAESQDLASHALKDVNNAKMPKTDKHHFEKLFAQFNLPSLQTPKDKLLYTPNIPTLYEFCYNDKLKTNSWTEL